MRCHNCGAILRTWDTSVLPCRCGTEYFGINDKTTNNLRDALQRAEDTLQRVEAERDALRARIAAAEELIDLYEDGAILITNKGKVAKARAKWTR